ncbi:hypothetical protein MKX03_012638, partial [Papaver bracteatum]
FSLFWLQVLNLPRFFNEETSVHDLVERSNTGTVLQVDLYGSIPRVHVMIDLDKPFLPGVLLPIGKGQW